MCSRVATDEAWARTALAVQGQEVMPMTSASDQMVLLGRDIEMRISTTMAGMASTTLVTPIRSSSNQPPT